jgi:hypothetical protein
MSRDPKPPTPTGGTPPAEVTGDVAAFLAKVAAMPKVHKVGAKGRLLFALDATASREPTWDQACKIQGEMFEVTASLGGLEVQMAYYRGFGEFHAGRWAASGNELIKDMTGVRCLAGQTQIHRVLRHAVAETRRKRVGAVVFVGDALEEDIDAIAATAGELGLLGVPVFMFHEGGNARVAQGFKHVATLTKGAYCAFDLSSARMLKELLAAVAVYAAGGRQALADYSKRAGPEVKLLTAQLK